MLEGFHPIIRQWFNRRFKEPTLPQQQGWPAIQAGQDTLIAAPTGSGKTLTAFLVCINHMVRQGLAGSLENATRVVYISPLKALSNDIRKNLEQPLKEIQQQAHELGYALPEIRTGLRTSDTPPNQRQAMLRKPPHILVTTPESLFLMVTAERSREILREVETVIVDEIHALAGSKRGAHLSLTLERLEHLTQQRPLRIGLSATQKPIETVANFLAGFGGSKPGACNIVDSGHQRDLDLSIEVPPSELSAVCSHEQWEEIYLHLKAMIEQHRSTLIFVNTRKLAERVTYHLCMHLGDNAVASHHGSLSKELRLDAEERLKNGELKAIVATASLELGIDIGYIDLVCQVGAPRSIATFLQRVGRSGHAVGALPKGRLFPLTRDELMEALALLKAVRAGQLDKILLPQMPLDVLAQQIVAAAAADEWDETDLLRLIQRSYTFHHLDREEYLRVINMLSEGYGTREKGLTYLHHDPIHQKIRGKKHARLTALTNGGAIPEQPLYRVVNIEDGAFVGTVHEDFAIERPAGTVFLLGNTSWQILQTRGTQMMVRDADGAPPTIPFWFGEAPGRTLELSSAVSKLRESLASLLPAIDSQNPIYTAETVREIAEIKPAVYRDALQWLKQQVVNNDWANLQAVHYVAVEKLALGLVPTQQQVVFERFFDSTGGMQLVIHAPYGMRINRGWGLALRKRFCRSFDFELQGVADDEGVVLSVGPNQSFPIEQLFKFLTPQNVKGLLEQAFLQAPFFRARWQWNANVSLAVLRNNKGKKIAPFLQRLKGDDLLTASFPAQTQCFEHKTGDTEIPYDHPLIAETMKNCLHEASDLEGLQQLLADIQQGKVQLIAVDSREPSPFAYERLNANPYAFLDDAPLEERRTRALSQRRHLSLDVFDDLTLLDIQAVRQVSQEAWPLVRNADELHELLQEVGMISEVEMEAGWERWMNDLTQQGRATFTPFANQRYWISALRQPLVQAAFPEVVLEPTVELPEHLLTSWDQMDAFKFMIRGHLDIKPMLTSLQLSQSLPISQGMIDSCLEALEAEGGILRGHFTSKEAVQWCERRLLLRIHRLTLDGLRKQIRPVKVEHFLHYLFRRHGLTESSRMEGKQALLDLLVMLQGYETTAGEWESEILPARLKHYDPSWLDELCYSGLLTWGRLHPMKRETGSTQPARGINRTVPLAFVLREHLPWILPAESISQESQPPESEDQDAPSLSSGATKVLHALKTHGAQFAHELLARTGLLKSQLDEALGELARTGHAHADSWAAIRAFLDTDSRRQASRFRGSRRFLHAPTYQAAGRWSPFPGMLHEVDHHTRVEHWAWQLLERYGVVFYDLIAREGCAPKWGELVPLYRRMEARGEIRGGRFILGVSGEQFALAEAVEELREVRDQEEIKEWVVISSSDPLNLSGVLDRQPRFSSGRKIRLLYENGVLCASYDNESVQFHREIPPQARETMSRLLKVGGRRRLEVKEEPPIGKVDEHQRPKVLFEVE